MSITDEKDPLDSAYQPDRVSYAVGAMLGVEDFTDEQTYHRGRLARALAFLYGAGTVAGLKVEYKGPKGPDEEIIVHPGLVLDRLGRIIEIPRDACMRLDVWFQAQNPDDLAQAFHAAAGGVIADVFVRFVACERGKQPAFATGPFDATDYAAPSRLRDGYRLDLVLRKTDAPALPQNPWPDLASEPDAVKRRAALHAAIFDSWSAAAHQRGENDRLTPLAEHAAGQDTTSVFLARIVIPAAAGDPPLRTATEVTVDNDSRVFVHPLGLLERLIGA